MIKRICLSVPPHYKMKEPILKSDVYKYIKLENGDVNLEANIDESANHITDIIMNIIKEDILMQNIEKYYPNMSLGDKQSIYINYLENYKEKEVLIKESVLAKVKSHVSNDNYINIDGFIKFRMKDILEYIMKICDIAVEDYIIKKDQDEFINVLKYFIEIQDEKLDYLKVHILRSRAFMLYDKHGNELSSIDDEDILNLVIKENLNYEDYLISTLLTLCPKKIEIVDDLKDDVSTQMIEMIESIFKGRVKVISYN